MIHIIDPSRIARFVPVVEEVSKSKRLTEEDLYWDRLDNYLDSPKKKVSSGGSGSYLLPTGGGAFIMIKS